MKEIEIIAGRKRFICTDSDVIISNGAIIWLESQRYFKNSRCPNTHPIISKTELNRLLKLGVLKKSEKNGLKVYNFCIQ
jgi:hypothetical protein